jgi:hypothetical protein
VAEDNSDRGVPVEEPGEHELEAADCSFGGETEAAGYEAVVGAVCVVCVVINHLLTQRWTAKVRVDEYI